jgi:hypothetical protein
MKTTKKPKYCYKAVQIIAGKMQSYSLSPSNLYCVTYEINKISKKKPETWGIWVFKNKLAAVEFVKTIGFGAHRILLCEYTGVAKKKIPMHPMFTKESNFLDILKLPDKELEPYQTLSEIAKTKSYVVDSIKPIKVLYDEISLH